MGVFSCENADKSLDFWLIRLLFGLFGCVSNGRIDPPPKGNVLICRNGKQFMINHQVGGRHIFRQTHWLVEVNCV